MAAIPLKIRGLNVVLVAFSLIVLGGAAYYMDMNYQVNLQSGASNVVQNISGKLVKKGTPAFSPCKDVKTNYALIGGSNVSSNTKDKGGPTPSCTPLVVQAQFAEPLIGLQVIGTGSVRNGTFYASSLKADRGTSPSPVPTRIPRPSSPPIY